MDSTIDIQRMRSDTVLQAAGEAIAKDIGEGLSQGGGTTTYTVQGGGTLSAIALQYYCGSSCDPEQSI